MWQILHLRSFRLGLGPSDPPFPYISLVMILAHTIWRDSRQSWRNPSSRGINSSREDDQRSRSEDQGDGLGRWGQEEQRGFGDGEAEGADAESVIGVSFRLVWSGWSGLWSMFVVVPDSFSQPWSLSSHGLYSCSWRSQSYTLLVECTLFSQMHSLEREKVFCAVKIY